MFFVFVQHMQSEDKFGKLERILVQYKPETESRGFAPAQNFFQTSLRFA